ncbi:helix-turn-helix transcriptional regulator [Micromonospora sp. CPCC 205561]|uniref:helix-turn-helix transcriptional regulator n=1 Tax=Micromonospora sp. CPCC 205561 TaxID=3122407 RepID=UPI002FF3E68B
MDRGPGDLMGPYEIAQRLGVTRSRFQQIVNRPTFPKPYRELRGMKVWLAEDVEAWIKEYRQPRPTDED